MPDPASVDHTPDNDTYDEDAITLVMAGPPTPVGPDRYDNDDLERYYVEDVELLQHGDEDAFAKEVDRKLTS